MKHFLIFLFAICSLSGFSQSESFDDLLNRGKAEFKKEFDNQDYVVAAANLEKAVKLKPKNAEAHYFLGYAYSRINSKDGRSMIESNLSLTLKTSEEFETVIKLTPNYRGEMVVLDPYSKLSSEWGTLAMSYWYRDKKDSAIWAFREGRNRGGFNEYMLEENKLVLDVCSSNSILMSSGDNISFSLWFLQIVDGYRNDVAVVDVTLLNTVWYPAFLVKKDVVHFDFTETQMDTIEYCSWVDSTITIKDFSWVVKPSYNQHFLLRGDLLFLSLLKENQFKRDVFFTVGFAESARLSLTDFLLSMVMVDKLNLKKNVLNNGEYNTYASKFLAPSVKINKNSPDQLKLLENIRINLLMAAFAALEIGDKIEAQKLVSLLDNYANEKTFPFLSDDLEKYAAMIRKRLK